MGTVLHPPSNRGGLCAPQNVNLYLDRIRLEIWDTGSDPDPLIDRMMGLDGSTSWLRGRNHGNKEMEYRRAWAGNSAEGKAGRLFVEVRRLARTRGHLWCYEWNPSTAAERTAWYVQDVIQRNHGTRVEGFNVARMDVAIDYLGLTHRDLLMDFRRHKGQTMGVGPGGAETMMVGKKGDVKVVAYDKRVEQATKGIETEDRMRFEVQKWYKSEDSPCLRRLAEAEYPGPRDVQLRRLRFPPEVFTGAVESFLAWITPLKGPRAARATALEFLGRRKAEEWWEAVTEPLRPAPWDVFAQKWRDEVNRFLGYWHAPV